MPGSGGNWETCFSAVPCGLLRRSNAAASPPESRAVPFAVHSAPSHSAASAAFAHCRVRRRVARMTVNALSGGRPGRLARESVWICSTRSLARWRGKRVLFAAAAWRRQCTHQPAGRSSVCLRKYRKSPSRREKNLLLNLSFPGSHALYVCGTAKRRRCKCSPRRA